MIRLSWSWWSLPGKRGRPLIISARMQPTAQISIDLEYCLKVSMISGARYQRVATYSVISPVSEPEVTSAVRTERASPKSHTLRSQLALSRRLDGFKSR